MRFFNVQKLLDRHCDVFLCLLGYLSRFRASNDNIVSLTILPSAGGRGNLRSEKRPCVYLGHDGRDRNIIDECKLHSPSIYSIHSCLRLILLRIRYLPPTVRDGSNAPQVLTRITMGSETLRCTGSAMAHQQAPFVHEATTDALLELRNNLAAPDSILVAHFAPG